MDGVRFAGHIEAAFRDMWRAWCENRVGKEGRSVSHNSRDVSEF